MDGLVRRAWYGRLMTRDRWLKLSPAAVLAPHDVVRCEVDEHLPARTLVDILPGPKAVPAEGEMDPNGSGVRGFVVPLQLVREGSTLVLVTERRYRFV